MKKKNQIKKLMKLKKKSNHILYSLINTKKISIHHCRLQEKLQPAPIFYHLFDHSPLRALALGV